MAIPTRHGIFDYLRCLGTWYTLNGTSGLRLMLFMDYCMQGERKIDARFLQLSSLGTLSLEKLQLCRLVFQNLTMFNVDDSDDCVRKTE